MIDWGTIKVTNLMLSIPWPRTRGSQEWCIFSGVLGHASRKYAGPSTFWWNLKQRRESKHWVLTSRILSVLRKTILVPLTFRSESAKASLGLVFGFMVKLALAANSCFRALFISPRWPLVLLVFIRLSLLVYRFRAQIVLCHLLIAIVTRPIVNSHP